ncbi:MAG: hypothetical protein PSV23_13120 [Brevundimonas sp.]|uniref:hypothetical protein n=1 Tax=Brevundimonas sp. TaxID=1871086 RepID=UPI002487359B|nr:hypothetical protein [Brevundimonas sp.]MDI1327726.1 hypothetical protein [Brevundimonas sp.]
MPRRPPKVIRPADPREDAALDAALAATFPASDPVAALAPAAERSRPLPADPAARPVVRTPSRPRKKDIQP